VASASLMSEAVKGRRREEIEQLYQQVHALMTGHPGSADLGKLAALGGVAEFPARVKCASLCWHTLNAALNDTRAPVSTE
jgi:nitrogen fixation NifU-like protein